MNIALDNAGYDIVVPLMDSDCSERAGEDRNHTIHAIPLHAVLGE